ncbi:IS3 family transposase, partial [Clostridium perfringens]
MSKKLFSKEEINKLSENKYVKSVSENAITYTDEFKLLFIGEYERGKNIRQIFEGAGFDIEMLGIARVKQASYR